MPATETRVSTKHAPKYIAQLCKHFGHKVQVEYDERSGRVDFKPGLCVMSVDGDVLHIRCEGDSPEVIGRVKFILDDHLRRFAWREEPDISWTAVP
jgi:hypothetical protein